MKNFIINNNGDNPKNNHLKTKKTKVESQIATLKQQEQAILKELSSWEANYKKADRLLSYLSEVERFSTKFLTDAVEAEKSKDNRDDYWLERLIKNKVLFAFKFETSSKSFSQLIWQKADSQVSQLKSNLRDCQSQLLKQERIFARMEIRRQNKVLLPCDYKSSLGCLGVYRCANCQSNYSMNNSQELREVAT